jgi:hypothetical protein
LIDIKDRYKKEQPVKDSAQQLSGKIVDEEVLGVLERSESMTAEHLDLIDAIMTLPETTFKKELQRRIRGINTVTVYCGIEEGRSYRATERSPPTESIVSTSANAKVQVQSASNTVLGQAIVSVKTDKRPKVCFLCLGNPRLPINQRVKEYATVGSLSRHYLRHHINKLGIGKQIDCQIYNVKIVHRVHLLNHTKTIHRTITRI